jgi:hypothetical protein
MVKGDSMKMAPEFIVSASSLVLSFILASGLHFFFKREQKFIVTSLCRAESSIPQSLEKPCLSTGAELKEYCFREKGNKDHLG